jgi:hypothetical protein
MRIMREFRYLLGCAVVSAVVVSIGLAQGWFVIPYPEGPYQTDFAMAPVVFVVLAVVAYVAVGLVRGIVVSVRLLKRRLQT